MSKAFETQELTKHFGDTKALEGVTLAADEGKIFSLLGPNGAGKTTIIRILSTLLAPDSGSAKVQGIDVAQEPQRVRELIGLAGQYAAVDEFQTGYENIYMTGRLYHLKHAESKKRANELLESLGLTEAASRPVRTYSGGMRRRLDLGASLVGRPRILFLDEPTTGLDPKTRLDLWKIIRDLVAGGTSILLTTQYLEEADELADKIAVVNFGKVIAEGTSDELKSQLGGDVVEFELHKQSDETAALKAVSRLAIKPPKFDEISLRVTVPVRDGSSSLMDVVQALSAAGIKADSLSLHRPSLDDVFLALTGETHDETAKTHPAAKPQRRKVQL